MYIYLFWSCRFLCLCRPYSSNVVRFYTSILSLCFSSLAIDVHAVSYITNGEPVRPVSFYCSSISPLILSKKLLCRSEQPGFSLPSSFMVQNGSCISPSPCLLDQGSLFFYYPSLGVPTSLRELNALLILHALIHKITSLYSSPW